MVDSVQKGRLCVYNCGWIKIHIIINKLPIKTKMKVKKDRHLLQLKRRIQDVPFYALEYKRDDLPLDPMKPFVLEQIGRLISLIVVII